MLEPVLNQIIFYYESDRLFEINSICLTRNYPKIIQITCNYPKFYYPKLPKNYSKLSKITLLTLLVCLIRKTNRLHMKSNLNICIRLSKNLFHSGTNSDIGSGIIQYPNKNYKGSIRLFRFTQIRYLFLGSDPSVPAFCPGPSTHFT